MADFELELSLDDDPFARRWRDRPFLPYELNFRWDLEGSGLAAQLSTANILLIGDELTSMTAYKSVQIVLPIRRLDSYGRLRDLSSLRKTIIPKWRLGTCRLALGVDGLNPFRWLKASVICRDLGDFTAEQIERGSTGTSAWFCCGSKDKPHPVTSMRYDVACPECDGGNPGYVMRELDTADVFPASISEFPVYGRAPEPDGEPVPMATEVIYTRKRKIKL